MPPRQPSPASIQNARSAFARLGSKTKVADELGIPRTTINEWLRQPVIELPPPKGRKEVTLENGVIIIAGDCHYWPGPASAGHRALCLLTKELAPNIIVMNGDVMDAACISRHPPIGWNHIPSVKEELEVCQERLHEVELAAGKALKFWTLGNHDARFETRLATVAPEFKDVHGISLSDHFPSWAGCWSLHVNGIGGVYISHRFKNGMHAAHNSALWAGRSTVTGHLHSLKVSPISDFNGTRFGVDGGCIAYPYADAFQDYGEDNPRSWRSGFVVLTIQAGRLLWPEVVHVIDEAGLIEFRGQVFNV